MGLTFLLRIAVLVNQAMLCREGDSTLLRHIEVDDLPSPDHRKNRQGALKLLLKGQDLKLLQGPGLRLASRSRERVLASFDEAALQHEPEDNYVGQLARTGTLGADVGSGPKSLVDQRLDRRATGVVHVCGRDLAYHHKFSDSAEG